MTGLIQQSEKWLDMRKNKIGSSDAPIIMEASPWKTPYQLWTEKVSKSHSSKRTEAMQRGIDLEGKARQKFEEMTGMCMIPQVIIHKEHNWMMASLDGMDLEQNHIVEIKCPMNKNDHDIAISGKIPEKYYPQLQHQIEVCGIDMAYYFSFDGDDGIILEIYRDEKYIKTMLEKEKEFFFCMENFIAPQTNERDYQSKTDDLTSYLGARLLDVKEKIKKLEKEESELMQDLILRCEAKNTLGRNFKLTKTYRKGSVDYSSIPCLKEIDLENYRKQSTEVWRVSNG